MRTRTRTDPELWTVYWTKVGMPQDARAAAEWWDHPGPLPEGFSLVAFSMSSPRAVQAILRERGLPRGWLEATKPPQRYD